MITHTNNGSTWLLVPVPEFSGRYNIHEGLLRVTTILHDKTAQVENDIQMFLPIIEPSEDYSIVGLASELTEEQWKEIVENIRVSPIGVPTTYKNYKDNRHYCDTGKESGLSLLRSHGLNEKTTLILKKQ